MQRRTSLLSVIVGTAVIASTIVVPAPAAAQSAPFCAPGQPARFVFGIATLQQRLGGIMGEPLECEHVNPENGDTLQQTTTGLAYYRPAINTPMFTDGQTHWALSNNQVIMWRNPSVEPPRPTSAESSYLATTNAVNGRADAAMRSLAAYQQLGDAGRLDSVDVADLGALFDELTSLRDTYATTPASQRLSTYDRMMLDSLNAAAESAELLLRARLTEIGEARDAFMAAAASRMDESARLEQQAADAYVQVLPIVVSLSAS